MHRLTSRGGEDGASDAVYITEQIIEGWEHHPLNDEQIPAHPMLWLDAARAFIGTKPDQMRIEPNVWRREAARRFEGALQACGDFPTRLAIEHEPKYNKLQVMCWYSDFLAGGEEGQVDRADLFDIDIWNEERFWSSADGKGAVTAQWLERQADEDEDARGAKQIYEQGHELYPDWRQFRFKAAARRK